MLNSLHNIANRYRQLPLVSPVIKNRGDDCIFPRMRDSAPADNNWLKSWLKSLASESLEGEINCA